MRTTRCPHRCPVGWQTYDVVRTPQDLRILRAVLFATGCLLLLAFLIMRQYPPYSVGLGLAAVLVALAGCGQTAILRALAPAFQ